MGHIESGLQRACAAWFRLLHPRLAGLLFAVPNGGKRNAREAARMKAEGVVPGVADMLLLVPRGGHGALCIEFKAPRGKQTERQKEWQRQAERHGNRYALCRSLAEFIGTVENYLDSGELKVESGEFKTKKQ